VESVEELKVLVTGITGFLGSNLAHYFLSKGYEIHSLIRRDSNLWRVSDVMRDINFHMSDLLAAEQLRFTVKNIKPDVIIHTAGIIKGFSEIDQEDVMASNFETTLNLVNSCIDLDYDSFINTGSAYEYGNKKGNISENEKTEPVDLYGITKMAATAYSSMMARKFDKPIITLRIFTPYGYYDLLHRLIPSTILKLLKGDQMNVMTPSSRRDFIFVDDMCRAYEAVMKKSTKIEPGTVLNVGSGKCQTVREVVQIISNLMNKENTVEGIQEGDMGNGIKELCSDNTEFMKKTGWKNEVDLSEGLTKTIEWFRENLSLYPGSLKL